MNRSVLARQAARLGNEHELLTEHGRAGAQGKVSYPVHPHRAVVGHAGDLRGAHRQRLAVPFFPSWYWRGDTSNTSGRRKVSAMHDIISFYKNTPNAANQLGRSYGVRQALTAVLLTPAKVRMSTLMYDSNVA